MFQPLSAFVGLRYVRARSHRFFVSFITWVSLIGVCVGVAALIVVLSVMNGFENELRDRLLALSSHARVVQRDPVQPLDAGVWEQALATVRRQAGVRAAAPYVEVQALAVHTPEMLPVQLRGIDPRLEPLVNDAAAAIIDGSLEGVVPGSDRAVIGSVIAQRLAVIVGDRISLLVPTVAADGMPTPRLREFEVAGIFEVGLPDHDGVLVLADRDDVAPLAAADPRAAGIRVRFDEVLRAPELAAELRRALPASFAVSDWTQDNASYFRAIRIEKTMMALILMLIVGVAAFNIVAMLVMVVTDKRTDIAILRTLGASPRTVMGAFMTQGLVIGWAGVLFGVLLGVLLALNVGSIVPVLEKVFGFRLMNPEVYYITQIPSDLQWPNVAWIAGTALLLTAIATIYPALRASRVLPAEALRYE